VPVGGHMGVDSGRQNSRVTVSHIRESDRLGCSFNPQILRWVQMTPSESCSSISKGVYARLYHKTYAFCEWATPQGCGRMEGCYLPRYSVRYLHVVFPESAIAERGCVMKLPLATDCVLAHHLPHPSHQQTLDLNVGCLPPHHWGSHSVGTASGYVSQSNKSLQGQICSSVASVRVTMGLL